jgi:2-polyprenyl-3-methyl-5-hydroxy-6-metoxy-1,4-benzoquinol methylase
MTTMDQSAGAGVFAFRVARTLNSGFTAMMISVGHRTGLFDVMAALPPSTNAQIATASGLSERYVREWLGAMVTAHVVDHDARTMTYFLPIEYAAVLARGAGANNLAPAAQLFTLLAQVEDLVVASFRGGGGVRPEAYEPLRQAMAWEKRELIDESYVDALLNLMPGMRTRLDLGATVLDAGCGDATVLLTMAKMFPHSLFRGWDLAADAIRRATEQRNRMGLSNVEFMTGDVALLDEPRAYDLVLAMESLHEMSFPRVVLRRIVASLKRDGALLLQEVSASSHLARNIDHPFAPMLYAMSCLHAVPVALSEEGEALGMMWGRERAAQLLAEAGFRHTSFQSVAVDPLSYFCVATK